MCTVSDINCYVLAATNWDNYYHNKKILYIASCGFTKTMVI